MKLLIKLVLGLGLLSVLIIGALVITLVYLDPNDYKETIGEIVKDETGRDLAIHGNISLSYYPWLGLDVEGVSLSNAKGFGDEPFLQTKTIKARAKLLPLLRKELEMDTLVLHGATINLAKNAEGISNWDDLAKPKTGDDKQTQHAMPLAALVLGGINIKEANVVWDDKQQGVQYKLNNVNINTGELKLGDPIAITASMNASASKPALSSAIQFQGTVAYADGGNVLALKPMELIALVKGKQVPGGETQIKLSSEIDIDLNKEIAQISTIDFTAFDTQLKGQLEATNVLSGKPTISGNIDLQGKDLPQLLKIAEVEPLASQLAKLSDKTFNLNTAFNADLARDDVGINTLALNVLGNKINAEIHASNIKSETPAIKGMLKAVGTDLPVLIKLASQFMGDNKEALQSLSKQLANAPRAFDIESDFDADLKLGAVNVSKLSIKALGMTTTATLNAKQVKSETPSINGELKAGGPNLPLLLQVAGAFQGKESGLLKLAQDLGKLKNKKFNIDTKFNADMKSGKVDLPSLTADALGFNVNGSLKGDNIQKSSGSMSGQFALSSKNPKPLLRVVGQADVAELIESIDLNTGINGNTTHLSLKPFLLDAVFSGKKIPNSPVKLSVKADSQINLEKEIFELSGLQVSGLGLDVKGAIKATQYKTKPALSGQIAIAPFDLRQFMQSMNQDIPKTADPGVLKRFALAATFSGTKESLSLKDIKADLDETRLQGNINLKSVSPLDLEFGLGVDKLNADRYLPPKTESKQTKAATPETVAAGVATKIPVETLRAVKIKGDFVMGQFAISNARLSDLELSIRADKGDIKLAPIAAKLYEGAYAGDIYLDAKAAEPKLTMSTNLTGVQTGPLLTDISGKADLLGEANINLALNSSGADTNKLKSRLSGKGDIKFNDGTLIGVDIPKALKQIEIMYESKRFGKIDTSGQTKFSSLTATLDINNGVVDNRDLLMLAPGFKVNGEGMLINLNDETWKYNMNVVVDPTSASSGEENYNLGGYDILIKCRDKIIDKKCLPDLASMIDAVLKETAKKKIGEAIGDKLGIKIPGLTTEEAPAEEATPRERQTESVPEQQQTQPVDPVKEIGKKLFDKLF